MRLAKFYVVRDLHVANDFLVVSFSFVYIFFGFAHIANNVTISGYRSDFLNFLRPVSESVSLLSIRRTNYFVLLERRMIYPTF